MKPCIKVGVRDLLQVGDAEHIDIALHQAAVGDGTADGVEFQRVVGEVQLQKVVLPRSRVGAPDHVEALASPRAGKIGEGPRGLSKGKGKWMVFSSAGSGRKTKSSERFGIGISCRMKL